MNLSQVFSVHAVILALTLSHFQTFLITREKSMIVTQCFKYFYNSIFEAGLPASAEIEGMCHYIQPVFLLYLKPKSMTCILCLLRHG